MRLALIALIAAQAFAAQIIDINVRDLAGRRVNGSVTVCPVSSFSSGSWTITRDCTVITVRNGAVSATLLATATATPAGQYYRARWKTSVTWDETWLVPASASSLTISDVATAIAPTPLITVAPTRFRTTATTGTSYCVVVASGAITGLVPCTAPE